MGLIVWAVIIGMPIMGLVLVWAGTILIDKVLGPGYWFKINERQDHE